MSKIIHTNKKNVLFLDNSIIYDFVVYNQNEDEIIPSVNL